MRLEDIIERALTEQISNTPLTPQQIKEFTGEIVKRIESNPALRALPENQLFDKVQPTIQVVFSNDHGSISNAAQYAIQVLVSQVIDDPLINIPLQFQLPEFCPYPGLRAFTEHEKSIFYGREAELSQFESCCEKPLIAITGASGVGKSSFLQAAVIPKIKQLFGENVLVLSFRATTTSDLLTEFASLLSSAAKKPTQAIRAAIEKSKSAVFDVLQSLRLTPDQRIFLIIDQFEEIFVAEDKNQQRKCLLDNILYIDSHSKSGSISIILASRKNFMEHPDYTSRTQLVQGIEKTAINLDALNIEGLRQAIENPLRVFNSSHQQNIHFQLGLVDVIADDFRNRSVSLPLVQYLLRLLWLDKHQLSHFSYAALGKLDRVLDRHATEIYKMFSDEQKPNVDSVLLSLVRSGLEGEHTRKRIRYDQVVFTATDELIVRRLTAENSRIISEQIIDDGRYLELTHEVILREWSLLQNLIDANRERLKLREQLLVNADLWFASKTAILPQGNNGYLYQGALYQHARKYVAQQKHAYDSDRRIVACLQVSQRRRKRSFLFAVSVVSVIAAVVAITIGILQRRAVDESQRADSNATAQAVAQTQADVNATAQAVAQAQANVNATAQVLAQAQADINATAQAIAEQQAQINENARATAAAQAEVEQQAKEQQAAFALSRKLAAAAKEAIQSRQMDVAALLSVEAYLRGKTFEAKNSLFASLETYPKLRKYLRNPDVEPNHTLLAFNKDGSMLASSESDSSITIWDVHAGVAVSLTSESKLITEGAPAPYSVRSLFFDESGKIVYQIGNSIIAWDLETLKSTIIEKGFLDQIQLIDDTLLAPNYASLAVSSNLQLMAMSLPGSRSIDIYKFSNNGIELLQTLTDDNFSLWTGIRALAFSPDHQRLAVGLGDSGPGPPNSDVVLWDIDQRHVITQSINLIAIQNLLAIECLALNNLSIYAAGPTVDIANDMAPPNRYGNSIFLTGCGLATSTDGKYVASGNIGSIILWDTEKQTRLGQELGLNSAYNLYNLTEQVEDVEVRFSVDSNFLIRINEPGLPTWSIETGEQASIASPPIASQGLDKGHTSEIVDTDRNVRYVLSGMGVDYITPITILDISSNQVIGTLRANASDIDLSPDGRYLVSYGFQAHAFVPYPAYIWNVDMDYWATLACEIANRNLTNEEWEAYLPGQPYRKTCDEVVRTQTRSN